MTGFNRLQHVKYLALSFSLVMLTGLLSVQGFFVEPKQLTAESSRVPAAVGVPPVAESSPGAGFVGGLDVFDWNCRDSKEAPSVRASYMRLKSKACSKQQLSVVDIKNVSNGFTATLFPANGGFTTDFIDLVEGENEILVQLKDVKGALTQKVIKVRRPAASEVPRQKL